MVSLGAELAPQLLPGFSDAARNVYTPEPYPMPTAGPVLGDALTGMLAARGIGFHPGSTTDHVDPEQHDLVLAGGERVGYDLLLGIPPHRPPPLIAQGALAADTGFVPVDPATLQTNAEGMWWPDRWGWGVSTDRHGGVAAARAYDRWFDEPWGRYAFRRRSPGDPASGRRGAPHHRSRRRLRHRPVRFDPRSEGGAVVAVDRDPGMLALASSRLAGPCLLGDVACLPLRSRSVDLAVAVTVLEFMSDPDAARRELARVTPPRRPDRRRGPQPEQPLGVGPPAPAPLGNLVLGPVPHPPAAARPRGRPRAGPRNRCPLRPETASRPAPARPHPRGPRPPGPKLRRLPDPRHRTEITLT